jgi:hypothetical protein
MRAPVEAWGIHNNVPQECHGAIYHDNLYDDDDDDVVVVVVDEDEDIYGGDTNNSHKVKKEIKCVPAEDLLPSLMTSGDNAQHYFPAVAVNALIRILSQPRNSFHYQGTIVALMFICKNLGQKVEPHLDKIIPAFLYALENVTPDLRIFVFEQLSGTKPVLFLNFDRNERSWSIHGDVRHGLPIDVDIYIYILID